MHIVFIVGRVLLVLIFIVSGVEKLLDIGGTAQTLGGYVTIPDFAAGYASQIQQATGMTVHQILAILIGVIELVGGLLIAFNVATRSAAAVLAIFTLLTIFYVHNFWAMKGAAFDQNLVHALKNLSILGGLLVFVVLGAWRPVASAKQV